MILPSHGDTLVEDALMIYTDGSFANETGSAACYAPQLDYKAGVKLKFCQSSTTSELYAILHALEVCLATGLPNVVIVSDSRASLQSILEAPKNTTNMGALT